MKKAHENYQACSIKQSLITINPSYLNEYYEESILCKQDSRGYQTTEGTEKSMCVNVCVCVYIYTCKTIYKKLHRHNKITHFSLKSSYPN